MAGMTFAERFREIPKAELHVHLEGSVEPATLLEIDPSLTIEEIEGHLPGAPTFDAFIESFIWFNRRLGTPDHYALAARHLLARLHAQNVTYAEITLSAGVILFRGLDLAGVYDAIWAETQRSPVRAFWIVDGTRQWGPAESRRVAEFAVSRRDRGIVAFGIGGYEDQGPAEDFADVFRFARDGGLHLVCHAGETVGPESVRAALAIGAERIGHGITSAEDPELLRELAERRIPLEISVSSNVATGVVPSVEAHPIRRIYDAGVRIIVNTDDPALFQTDLCREYQIAAEVFGLPVEELARESLRFGFATDVI